MGHSYVEFRGRSRLLQDVEIVAVVHLTLDTARHEAGSPPLTGGVEALLRGWRTLIDVYAPGCLDLGLDAAVRTDADHDCLLGLLARSRTRLERIGPVVPGHYLDAIVDAPAIFAFGDWPTTGVIRAHDRFAGVVAPELSAPE
jgi:hypothetical protein